EQARRSSPPNRVRSPTDRQFASGCSPRRFGPTQLPSATKLWHTPARTFTVLMWRLHGRTHSREGGNPGFALNFPGSGSRYLAGLRDAQSRLRVAIILVAIIALPKLLTAADAGR